MARILAVDDDAIFLEMLCDILEEKTHEVVTAPDGLVALDIFKENKFDLVICDLIMPKKDGAELIEEIKRTSPDVKIIAITGMSDFFSSSTRMYAIESLGADRILDKPFRLKELLKAVDEVLNIKDAS